MKPAQLTITYVVYPPDYKPGDGYRKADTLKLARRLAVRYGIGAEIWRWTYREHRPQKFRPLNVRARCKSSSSNEFHSRLVDRKGAQWLR